MPQPSNDLQTTSERYLHHLQTTFINSFFLNSFFDGLNFYQKMRCLLLITLFSLNFIACHSTLPVWKREALANLSKQERYFCEVALGSEFGKKYHKIRKWNAAINVYLTGTSTPHLERELDGIIEELNELLPAVNMMRVFEPHEANLTIFLGKGEVFARQFRPAREKIAQNWGLVFIRQNGRGEIQQSHVYIDVYRATDPIAQKHLLREELTQALGLLNDSQQFPDSIFYQEWTLTTDYSDLDKWLIRTLYREDIEPGMTLKNVVQQLENITEVAHDD